MIFRHLEYRHVIKDRLAQLRGSDGSAFTQQALAAKMGVQKTYLSAVLAGRGDLNPDHLFLAAEFLRLSEEEETFLHLLWNYGRCKLKARRQRLHAQIREMQATHLRTEENVRVESVPDVEAANSKLAASVFMDPWASIVLTALHIAKWQSDLEGLAMALGIDRNVVDRVVATLESVDLVTKSGSKRVPTQRPLHVPQDSNLGVAYKLLQRQMALSRLLGSASPQSKGALPYNFSVTVSSDEDAILKFREGFQRLLKAFQLDVLRSKATGVYQLGFDILQWA